MEIDHIFIFTDDNGKVADELVEFGLTEGSGQSHPGQGTTNRKFYFENFFLEIVWVHNENEITSELVRPTGLWQRANYKTNNFSRFGLGIINTEETDKLFESALKYQPVYFTEGLTFDILKNESRPDLPWMFRMPFKGRQERKIPEPTQHRNGLERLTKARFTYTGDKDSFLDFFENEPQIVFSGTPDLSLILTFDYHRKGLSQEFEKLNLTIEY